jgi:hypothetical protein
LKGVELAERLETTPASCGQVLTPLVPAGWVRSDPGSSGGYGLGASVSGAGVLDAVEAVDGPTDDGRRVVQDAASNPAMRARRTTPGKPRVAICDACRPGVSVVSGDGVERTRWRSRAGEGLMGMDDRSPNCGVSRATRRTVVGTLLSMPLVAWFARRAAPAGSDAARRRPASIGASSGRCAVCGGDGHSMLSCPDSPRVV